MIHFLVTADHPYTLDSFFAHWAKRYRDQIRVVHYESKSWRRITPAGTWVFTDLERLTADELAGAQQLYRRLSADRSRWRPVNDPSIALRRHGLLKALADRGINTFQAYGADQLPDTLRFPVFVRSDNNHNGAMSALLPDRDTLDRKLAGLRTAVNAANLLVVEYCPYQRSDGLFVKRSVMRVGESLVPRHLLFSRKWELKSPDILDDACIAEEEAFVADMPHTRELREIFDLAGIEYGRMDYTVFEDRLQVFEINTNPMLVPPVSEMAPSRWAGQARSAQMLLRALEDLDAGMPAPDAGDLVAMSRSTRAQGFFHRARRRFHRPRL